MKTKHLLSILLTISVSLNVLIYTTSWVPQNSECPDVKSYANGVEISQNDAQSYADAFNNNYPGTSAPGGIIAGDAIKQLFCDPNTNGLAYHFGMDLNGQVASPDAIFLVLMGTNVSTDAEGNPVSWPRTGNRFYMNNNWCPPNCVSINE